MHTSWNRANFLLLGILFSQLVADCSGQQVSLDSPNVVAKSLTDSQWTPDSLTYRQFPDGNTSEIESISKITFKKDVSVASKFSQLVQPGWSVLLAGQMAISVKSGEEETTLFLLSWHDENLWFSTANGHDAETAIKDNFLISLVPGNNGKTLLVLAEDRGKLGMVLSRVDSK